LKTAASLAQIPSLSLTQTLKQGDLKKSILSQLNSNYFKYLLAINKKLKTRVY